MEPSTGGGLDDRTFEDYDPAVEWSHADAGADAVTISLPGFKKKELRVQVDNHGYLHVRGERPVAVGGSDWIRFLKRLKLPDNCDIEGIRSKFVNETLTVTLPKKSYTSPPEDSAPEPAPNMPEKDEDGDEDEEEGEEGTVGKEVEAGGRLPMRWLLATVAAVLFVGITSYVVWRKLRSGCAASAGDHGPGELVGAGSYVNEM